LEVMKFFFFFVSHFLASIIFINSMNNSGLVPNNSYRYVKLFAPTSKVIARMVFFHCVFLHRQAMTSGLGASRSDIEMNFNTFLQQFNFSLF
jgi:hypothetical protein